MTFATDTFTDTAGTLLESHSADSGAAWVKQSGYSSGSMVISAAPDANQARAATTADNLYRCTAAPAIADYSVQADFAVLSAPSDGNFGLILRASASAQTFYWFLFAVPLGQWCIYKMVGGTASALATASGTVAAGVTYTLKASAVGATLTFTVNGATVATAADSSITAAGYGGIYLYDAGTSDSGGVHIDNFSAATATTTVPVSDANLAWSPYNWYASGSVNKQSNNPGAYVKGGFTGTSLAVNVDVSPLTAASAAAGDYPVIFYAVDPTDPTNPADFTSRQLTASDASIALASGLAGGSHNFILYFTATGVGVDRWTTPSNVLRITGFAIDSGAGTVAATGALAVRAKNLLVFGDSVTEGRQNATTTGVVASAFASYANGVARQLNAEVGIIAFQGQGYTSAHAAAGNVPPLWTSASDAQTSWNKFDATHSRLSGGALAPAADFVLVAMGQNDTPATDASLEAIEQGFMTAVRAAAPAARVLVLVPFSLAKESAITAGFAAQADANSRLIDLGSAGQSIQSSNSSDGVHPTVAGQGLLSTAVQSALALSASISGSALERGKPGQTITLAGATLTFTANAGDYTLSNGGTVSAASVAGTGATLTVTAPGSTGTTVVSFGGMTSNGLAVTDTVAPAEPTLALAAVNAIYTLRLSWAAESDAFGGGVASFSILHNGSAIASVGGGVTTYVVSGVSPGDTLGVEAIDPAGNASPIDTLTYAAPAMPAASDVRAGAAVNNGVGTLAVPAALAVLAGVAVDAGVGTVTLPAPSTVKSGVNYGANGSQFSGTYAVGGAVTLQGSGGVIRQPASTITISTGVVRSQS
jgi:lysophospholipase L1-like esterase